MQRIAREEWLIFLSAPQAEARWQMLSSLDNKNEIVKKNYDSALRLVLIVFIMNPQMQTICNEGLNFKSVYGHIILSTSHVFRLKAFLI